MPNRTIFWTPVGPPPPSGGSSSKKKSKISSLGVINDVLEENKIPSYYESIPTTDPDSRKPLIDKPPAKATVDEYNGPKFVNRTYKEQSQPDDRKIIKRWFEFVNKGFTKETKLKPLASPKPPPENSIRTSVYQEKIEDGLWWGLESSDFLTKENMPFWVTLELPRDPPTPSEYETLYIISLGVSSTSNKDRYDLLLSRTRKPQLIDYYGISGGGEGDANIREFDVDSSRINFTDTQLDIGFMTAGGRLIIVGFDPVGDIDRLNAFKNTYNTGALTAGVDIVGPWTGNLSNSSERLALKKPEAPDTPGDPVCWINVDEVIYADVLPWPEAADGEGYALQRISADQYHSGNDPDNWEAALPTPASNP